MAPPKKTKAIIRRIIEYTDDVRLFNIEVEKKLKNKFRAGQFLHLTLDEYDPCFDWPESRVFSIATSPGRSESIDIVVSRKGKYTTRMFNEIKEGTMVWLKLPFGDFNFGNTQNKKNILIAGGTGISPFISFLQQSIDNEEQLLIDLYYGVRRDELIIFNELIKECDKKLINFKYRLFIEDPQGITDLEFIQGKLPIKEIIDIYSNHLEEVYYISGPQSMIKNIEKELMLKKVLSENIHYDKWE